MSNQEIPEYTPSPVEAAFSNEFSRRFKMSLGNPRLDSEGNAIRLSNTTVINGNSLSAYYKRQLLSTDRGSDVTILKGLNPSFIKELGPKPMDWEKFDDEDVKNFFTYEERFVAMLRKRILDRDGVIDERRALTDPFYFTEKEPIKQWSEAYGIAIDSRIRKDDFSEVHELMEARFPGRYSREDPEVYISFDLSLNFFNNFRRRHGSVSVELNVAFPRIEYIAAVALKSSEMMNDSRATNSVIEGAEEFDVFANTRVTSPEVTNSLHLRTNHRNAKAFMKNIGAFVERIVRVT